METYILTILVVVFFVYVFFFLHKDKPEKNDQSNTYDSQSNIRSLADEEIFDPETGRVITLEEAESGRWEAYADTGVIPTDVILKNYYPSQHNELFIKNFLFENGFKLSEPSTECVELWDRLKVKLVIRLVFDESFHDSQSCVHRKQI